MNPVQYIKCLLGIRVVKNEIRKFNWNQITCWPRLYSKIAHIFATGTNQLADDLTNGEKAIKSAAINAINANKVEIAQTMHNIQLIMDAANEIYRDVKKIANTPEVKALLDTIGESVAPSIEQMQEQMDQIMENADKDPGFAWLQPNKPLKEDYKEMRASIDELIKASKCYSKDPVTE